MIDMIDLLDWIAVGLTTFATALVARQARALLAVLLLAAPALAAETVAVPAQLVVPSYTAQYSPFSVSQEAALAAILAELRTLRAEVATLRSGPSQVAAPVPNEALAVRPAEPGQPDHFARLLTTNCAKCHEAQVADRSGGGLTLFRGNAPALGSYEKRLARKQIESGKMPPAPATLTAEEKSFLVERLSKELP
jgi:hypothetical protein